jgi:hypothetical protein
MHMRTGVLAILILLLNGCAASLTFVDRTDGQEYFGKTGGTMSSDGKLSALIEDTLYSGSWIYSAGGGGYTLGTATATTGTTSAVATGTAFAISAQGNGLMNMRSESGAFIRCVFNFNTLSDRGIGECRRNDGRLYDLKIKR